MHDYTITVETLVFSRDFRTGLFRILQEKAQPHQFESFSRCQMKGNPAGVEPAGFLVISRGLGDFGAKPIGSFVAFWCGLERTFPAFLHTNLHTKGRGPALSRRALLRPPSYWREGCQRSGSHLGALGSLFGWAAAEEGKISAAVRYLFSGL